MSLLAVRVRPRSNHDAVVAALFEAGSLGVHEDGDTFVTSLPDDGGVDLLRRRVAAIDPGAELDATNVPPPDFAEWRGTVGAHTVGGITVAPPWVNVEPPVRVVIANILSSVILSMLPVIAASLTPEGEAILSGIMLEEREMMLSRLREAGWRLTMEESEDEWWSAGVAIGHH